MSTLNAILQPSQDGSVHLPVPPELRGAGKLRVVAWLEPEEDRSSSVGAGQWAQEARGIARLLPGESQDDARQGYLLKKFGTP